MNRGRKGRKEVSQATCTNQRAENGEGNRHFALTFKALLAGAPVSIHQVITSSSILAWVGKAFIFIHFTVDANPACITEALVSENTNEQNSLLWGMKVRLSQR